MNPMTSWHTMTTLIFSKPLARIQSLTPLKNTLQAATLLLSVCIISPLAKADFNLPAYQKTTLDNGLTLFVMPQKEVPLVDIQWVIKGGSSQDGKVAGLTNLTTESLTFGSGKLSKRELEDTLAFHGANLFTTTGKESSNVGLSIASKDLSKLLPLFADIVQRPQFNKEDFKRHKKRALAVLKQHRESPSAFIGDAFNNLYFGEHPLGQPIEGDAKSLPKLSLNDVKKYYQQFFTPNNSALVVVGDVNVESLQKSVNALFGDWAPNVKTSEKGAPSEEIANTTVTSPTRAQVLLLDKPDAAETTFMIGGKGIDVNSEHWVASSVINTVLGGRFTSWLNDELRVNSGLSYGARSRFDSFSNTGTFKISTFTKTDTTFKAIDLALKTYQRLWDTGIDATTLASAKAYIKGQFPTRYETSGQLAGLLGRNWVLGLSDDFINRFEERVDALTVESMPALINQLFPKKDLQFILIGKAEDLRIRAKAYGRVKEADLQTFKF